MDVFIYDLDVNSVDSFINPSTDMFGRITRKATDIEHTVDLLINVEAIAINADYMIIEYPNNAIAVIRVPAHCYHKIEVL